MPGILAKVKAFNDWFGLTITSAVGSMWCAYAFAAFALYGMPEGIKTLGFVNWFAEEFIQLVLLSVIIVGQNLQGVKSDNRAIETHDAVMEELRILHEKHDTLLQSHAELKEAVSGNQQ